MIGGIMESQKYKIIAVFVFAKRCDDL